MVVESMDFIITDAQGPVLTDMRDDILALVAFGLRVVSAIDI